MTRYTIQTELSDKTIITDGIDGNNKALLVATIRRLAKSSTAPHDAEAYLVHDAITDTFVAEARICRAA